MNQENDWYYRIVGHGNVNQGLGRMVGFILAVIVILALIFWIV
ncbi:MAG: hypothetical protein QM684_06990 [Rhizobium sp.]